jgi:alpha-beta hydrolase superfamily lysophospholipase
MAKQARMPESMFTQCEPFLAHMLLAGFEWEDLALACSELELDELCDDWNDWHTHWTRVGRLYEAQARRSAAQGNRASQRRMLLKAAASHHLAELMFFDNPEAKFMSRRRVSGLFLEASPFLPYGLRMLSIPHGELELPACLLHSRWTGPAPCVLLVNSLCSAKEIELYAIAQTFLAHGLSVLVFDGPGQGTLAGLHRLPVRFEQVVESVLAQVRQLGEVDPDRIGICGLGHGGYLAARCAALLPRELGACASISGGYDHDNHSRLSPLVRQELRYAFGQPDDAVMGRLAREELNLRAIPRPTTPLLAIHGGRDTVVPYESCIRLLEWARGDRDFISYPEERHACANRSADFLPRLGSWMANALASPRH